jgi:hypothetical protein
VKWTMLLVKAVCGDQVQHSDENPLTPLRLQNMKRIKVMKPVVLESPYAGDFAKNIRYARACMHDCMTKHDEAPYASHLLYTQEGVLDDEVPGERKLGMEAGFAWHDRADYTVVYIDLGVSVGMQHGIDLALEKGQRVIFRELEGWENK